jgi:hypothetical protein
MTRSAQVVRWVAFGLMAAFGLVGTLFVAGYAFEDLEVWAAVGVTAAWVLPMAGLSALALLRPETAARLLVGVTAVVAVATVLDSLFSLVPRDDWGPVGAIVVFATGVALGFLGLRQAMLSGLLLVALAAAQLLSVAVGFGVREHGEGPGLGAMLGTSGGVVVVPFLLVGALFLLAGSLGHEHLHRPGVRPVH